MFILTAKVSRINLQRMDGSFKAAPDCIASHIYERTEMKNWICQIIYSLLHNFRDHSCNRSLYVNMFVWVKKFQWLSNTSLASFSSRAFLSVVLKASSVLVLYRVPMAGQQRAGVGPSLQAKHIRILHLTVMNINCMN